MAKNNGTIRRRIGGISQQTGKGTDISKLKRKSKKYEGISSTYEAARKDKPKRKVTTALGAGARGAGIEAGTEALQEKKKTTTKKKTVDAKKDNGATIRKNISSAVGRKAAGKAAAAKVFKRATEKAAATARGKTARERLYSRARKRVDPKEVARRIALRKETAPVKMKLLGGKKYNKPIGPPIAGPLDDPLAEINKGGKVSRRSGGKIMVGYKAGGKV